jgi:hypothetical protein
MNHDSAGTSASVAAAPSELLIPPPDGQGIQLSMDYTIEAGAEREVCQFVTLPDSGLWVNRQEIRFSNGSHHVVLWRTGYDSIPTVDTNGNTVDTSGVFDCASGPAASWKIESPAGISQSPTAQPLIAGLPEGTAVRFEPNSVMVLDLHTLNASDQSLDSHVRVNLWQVPDASVTTEAGIYFFYNSFIRLQAHSPGHARMSCPVQSELHWMNVQTHTHRRGLGGVANLVSMGNVEQVYESHDWENVPMTTWDGGRALHPGDVIDYRCAYQNDEDRVIAQGQTTRDEMCNLYGLYYPRDKAFETCSVDGSWANLASAATYIGGGDHDGATTARCMIDSLAVTDDNGAGLYGCVVDSCEKLATSLTPAVNCQYTKYYSDCMSQCSGGSGCADCIQAACKEPFTALASAGCE